ncbi:DUF6510 family protein [Cellulosimicrobium sp. CpK407]|uniref:DUF6510 family protein n=1 Tax=Cellulosimicrobium sp. CpK407 TaxID=3229847 RepID=UPI003F2B1714
MTHLDGNVLAGVAADLFAFDTTTATGRCAECRDVATLAEALVYGAPMGFVARCRACLAVLVVIVERPGGTLLDLRGMRWVTTHVGDRRPAVSPGSTPPDGPPSRAT